MGQRISLFMSKSQHINDSREITLESFQSSDFIENGKVLSREEFCKKFNLTQKKMRNIAGGYKNLLAHFELTTNKINSYESKQNIDLFPDFVNEYLSKYDRIPLMREVIENNILTRQYIKNNGGYESLIEKYGFNYHRGYGASDTFYKNDMEMISEFKDFYGDSAPPSYGLKLDFEDAKISFSKNHIEGRFGTYSNFLKQCGYKTGTRGFYSYREFANDGHMCDSKAEVIIDNFMVAHNIPHIHNGLYKNVFPNISENYKFDWRLDDNTIVEYFGLVDKRNVSYNLKTEAKIKLLTENKIPYLAIYPNDVRRKNGLLEIFHKYINSPKTSNSPNPIKEEQYGLESN